MKEMSDLICGKAAVGGNYNSTRDNMAVNSFLNGFISIKRAKGIASVKMLFIREFVLGYGAVFFGSTGA